MFSPNLSSLLIATNIIFFLALAIYYKFKKTNKKECSGCGCKHPDRVRRPFLIKLLFFFITNLKYYRCPGCGNHFILVPDKNVVLEKRLKYLKV